jgi:predicted GNAT family N-acyltransferase
MSQTFIVEPLNLAKHRREEFDCGVEALNDFLRLRARKEMEAETSACFVMVPADEPTVIAGYYTLSAATVQRTALPEPVTTKLPRYYELPATLPGRLARDLRFKGQQIGERLMASMLHRTVRASEEVPSWAIVTDPKEEKARSFYASFGFHPLTESRQFDIAQPGEVVQHLAARSAVRRRQLAAFLKRPHLLQGQRIALNRRGSMAVAGPRVFLERRNPRYRHRCALDALPQDRDLLHQRK